MNDMRRTLLWSVFAFSLLMLWDGWLRHTGQPSLFAPAPAVAQAPASGASAAGVPAAASALPGTVASAPVAAQAASNCQSWWRSSARLINSVLTISYFDRLGLPRLS